VVDDAIIVVENVERIMSEERSHAVEASRKAMGQISGAIIGVTLVLVSVFVPLAFFSGSIGNIYRQFSATMSLDRRSRPSSRCRSRRACARHCSSRSRPGITTRRRFFGWFNRASPARPKL